ncbi:MAG: outer membrane protein assembly factor BamA [Helicobacteraceae bacterium]|nr:outer membrane protein assembly factor BamA [Helicobacteraceae bacterium]
MRIITLICLLNSIIFASEIKSITYDGLVRMSNLIANEISDIKVGDKLNKEKINKAIIAFYKQDYFDDIYATFDENNGNLSFHFKEKPVINNIEIKGYGNETETKDVEKLINIKRGDTYDIYKEQYAKEIIIKTLEDKGIYGSVVEIDNIKIEDSISLVFNINKGENIIIRKSYYEGATLDKDEIESLSANRERHSWLGWLPWWSNGELKLKELEFDNLRIQDVYMRKGYLDAVISNPLVNANFLDYDAILMYKIIEGKRYKVNGVEIRKNDDISDIFPIETLEELINIKEDEYFNIESVRNDIEILKSYIMDQGYAYARILPDLDKNEENAEVKVIFSIDIGKKVNINNVIVTGNTVSADRIIRREMLIAPNDTYSITNIRKSENALRRTGFFDKVQISEIRVDETSMNLLVEVVEGRTGEIMFGLGYGSYDKLMLNASLKERNIFGTGMSVQFYVNYSKYSQLFNIGFTNPRILDSEYSSSINIYRSYFDNYDYVENSTGFNISVGRNITDTLAANVIYEISKTNISDFSDPVSGGLLYANYFPVNGVLKSSITPGLYFDNTDDYYFPKNGAILEASSEFAGLGGNAKYIKLFGKAGLYYHLKNLIDFNLILRYKAQIGGIFGEIGNKDIKGVPITNTFYMGGIGTVRGYETYSLTPKDANGLRIGGRYMFTNSIEASYGVLEAINMRIAAFFDYGMIGKNSFNEINRMSWGLALEWVSPIGPLVFVFPFAINPQPNDNTSSFEFTMGTRF